MPSIVKSAILVSLASLMVSFANMGSHLVMARTFGAGAEIDTFFVALSLPLLVGGLLSGAVGYQVVPLLVHHKGDDKSVREYRNALVFFGLAGGLLLGAAGVWASMILLRHFPNAESLHEHSAGLIAMTGWGTASATLLTSLLVAVCHSIREFTRPALLGLLAPSFSIIASLWAGHHGSPVLLVACALLIGQILSALALLYRLRGKFVLRWPTLAAGRQVMGDMKTAPLILASMLVFTCFGTLDAFFAGYLDEGAVTCLAYAQRTLVALAGLAVNGVGVVMLPSLSQSAARGDHVKAGNDMITTLRAVVVVLAPVAMVAALLAVPVTRLLFGGGRFTEDDVMRLGGVLPYMFTGMLAMSCSSMLFKGLYAVRDYAGAAAIGFMGAACYAIGCAWLTGADYTLHGFGMAYILCWLLVCAAAAWRLSRKLELPLMPARAAGWTGRITVVLLLVGLIVVVTRNALAVSLKSSRFECTLGLGAIVLLAFFAYVTSCAICRMREVTSTLSTVFRRIFPYSGS